MERPTDKTQTQAHFVTATKSSDNIHVDASQCFVDIPKAVRHIEKRRSHASSCAFADRVAAASVQQYRARVTKASTRPTCLATIVSHDAVSNAVHVLAGGVGTKFLSQNSLQQPERVYGERVRDSHAEVLARRAFCRFLLLQMRQLLQQQKEQKQKQHEQLLSSPGCSVANDVGKDHCAAWEQTPTCLTANDEEESSCLPCILELWTEEADTNDCSIDDKSVLLPRWQLSGQQENNDMLSATNSSIRFRLRPNITLHMYCSSAPCGNAVLKKYAKGGTTTDGQFDSAAAIDTHWPVERHAPILAHAVPYGQFALLVKRDGSVARNVQQRNDAMLSVSSKERKSPDHWPCHCSDNWCPPGTTTTMTNAGSLHTCSDKLARWNCLGLQGALIMSLLQQPLYLSTLTVGRKLTLATCRRAVCCRVGPDTKLCSTAYPCENTVHAAISSRVSSDDTTTGPVRRQRNRRLTAKPPFILQSPFGINHPTVMGTRVYLDDNVIEVNHTTNTTSHARFDSSLSWAWWSGQSGAECVDALTGYVARDSAIAIASVTSDSVLSDHDVCQRQQLSKICTVSLVELYSQIKLNVMRNTFESKHQHDGDTTLPVTLAELRSYKESVSPRYELNKQLLLSKHDVFKYWKRRQEQPS